MTVAEGLRPLFVGAALRIPLDMGCEIEHSRRCQMGFCERRITCAKRFEYFALRWRVILRMVRYLLGTNAEFTACSFADVTQWEHRTAYKTPTVDDGSTGRSDYLHICCSHWLANIFSFASGSSGWARMTD